AVAFDKEYGGDEFDLLTDVGFLNALYHTTMLEAGQRSCQERYHPGLQSFHSSSHCLLPRSVVVHGAASFITFGRALAACRTKRLKKHQKLARRFMREAKQSETSMDERPRVNDAWVRGANLRPILAYLSKCK
ncbi:unnamed protein product, partial [Durusdinium trenchii]